MAVPPAPVRVPSQRPLAPSVSSVKSVANVNRQRGRKDGKFMFLNVVHGNFLHYRILTCKFIVSVKVELKKNVLSSCV